jgi:hypothetical protein
MPSGTVHVSTERPDPPTQADFVLTIGFRKGEGSPQRIFQAADALIRAFQHLDQILCSSIDTHLEPMLLLEDIEAGSLRTWLRNALTATDDDALKKIDWRPAIGRYLVRAKYIYIEWANDPDPGRASLVELAKRFGRIASETDVRQLPAYAPPAVIDLAETAKEIDAAKGYLLEGDSVSYEAVGEPPSTFDLSVMHSPDQLVDLSIKETVKFPPAPMTLIVRRPDYLGSSKWEFRHGRRSLSIRIDDAEWVCAFQARKVDVRPGDALRCMVCIENSYGHDNELMREGYAVTKVIEVLENQAVQGDLLEKPKPISP